MTYTEEFWKQLALAFAAEAGTKMFESRRGVWYDEAHGVLAVYNNNPYAHYPTKRDEAVGVDELHAVEDDPDVAGVATVPAGAVDERRGVGEDRVHRHRREGRCPDAEFLHQPHLTTHGPGGLTTS